MILLDSGTIAEMLKTLINPKTEEYQAFKKEVLSQNFAWRWFPSTLNFNLEKETSSEFTEVGIYYHTLLYRPDADDGQGFPLAASPHVSFAAKIIKDILLENEIKLTCILRISTNCVHALKEVVKTPPHYDHEFEHKNFLIYLNDSSGDTFVEGERSICKEDKVILFSGKHYHETPLEGRRIVLVATFN